MPPSPKPLRTPSQPASATSSEAHRATTDLLTSQLVDKIVLLTYPVVIGQGTRLFPATGPDAALDLVDSRSTPKGLTIQVYRFDGDVR